MSRSLILILSLLPSLARAQTAPVTYTPPTVLSSTGTATALAANGANCSAGTFPLGVDASGAAEGCSSSLSNPSLGTGYLSSTKTAGAAGTTIGLLAKLDTSGNVVDLGLADTVGALGVAISTKTTGQAGEIATRGIVSCVADNATTIGNILGVGTTTAGRCKDLGQTVSTSVSSSLQIVGKALSAVSAGALVSTQLYGPGHYGAQPNVANATGVLPLANGGAGQARGRFLVTSSAGAFTCNFSLGDWCVVTTTSGGNVATFSNPTGSLRYLITVIQPSSGAAGTVTWPAAAHWPGSGSGSNVPPALATTNSAVDVIACAWTGTTHFCEYGLNFAP